MIIALQDTHQEHTSEPHHYTHIYVEFQSQFKACGLCLWGWDKGKETMLWDWKWRQSSVKQSENGYRWVNWGGTWGKRQTWRETGRCKMEGEGKKRDRVSITAFPATQSRSFSLYLSGCLSHIVSVAILTTIKKLTWTETATIQNKVKFNEKKQTPHSFALLLSPCLSQRYLESVLMQLCVYRGSYEKLMDCLGEQDVCR